ncbi:MAG: helix-turn-helix domain-containing protein, partial [Spirochaetota bacterium]
HQAFLDKNLSFSKNALDKLNSYYFKGNIRELQNIVERAYIMAEDEVIDDVPNEVMYNEEKEESEVNDFLQSENLDKLFIQNNEFITLEELEKMAIKKALEFYSYNLSNTARKLKIGRDTLYRKVKNYDIEIKRNND